MKNYNKVILTLTTILTLFSIVFNGCKPDIIEDVTPSLNNNLVNCNGKVLMKFLTWDELKAEHQNLYDDYTLANNDEQVLVDFESAKGHYSLRNYENDMDEGVIADDPNFDSWDYTTDDIMETLLNEDGMLIIGDSIYLWREECTIIRMKYDCNNYSKLNDYINVLESYFAAGTQSLIAQIVDFETAYNIETINFCENYKYDLEVSSSRPEGNVPVNPNNSRSIGPCGYGAFINHTFISDDPVNQKVTYRLEVSTIQNSSMYLFTTWFIDVQNPGDAKIVAASTPGNIGQDVFSQLSIDSYENLRGRVYFGQWLELEIDYNALSQLKIGFYSKVTPVCGAISSLTLDLRCPLSISTEPLNAGIGQWNFNIEGLSPGSYRVIWTFGDGQTQVVSNSPSVIYNYAVPCGVEEYTVSATIKDAAGLCKTVLVTKKNAVAVGDPCKFKWARKKRKGKIGGKRFNCVIKIRTALGSTWFKTKFKWRKSGEKSFSSMGFVYEEQGSNCIQTDISTLLSPKTKNSKGTLRQTSFPGGLGQKYYFDANGPYSTTFTHSDGSWIPITLSFGKSCVN
jgi:hypothetical protein